MIDLKTCPVKTKDFEERNDFMTIGNFRHAPNWDVVLYLQEIWPLIRKKLPKAVLNIYGSYPPPKATALNNPKTGFLIKGWADDAYEVMENAKICLAPIRFGAGIKGKLIDSMMTQTPSITSSIGSEGMYTDEVWPGVIEDDIENFVNKAVELYTNKDKWNEAKDNCQKLLYSKYDGDALGEKLISHINDIRENLASHRLNNFTGAMLRHHSMASTKYMSQWIAEKNK